MVGPTVGSVPSPAADPRAVFVVHGRNDKAAGAMFTFLRALGLKPLEWSQAVALTGKGSPYVGEILDAAFEVAQAVVVLMTPDEVAYLRPEFGSQEDPETDPGPQARPNVLFEAGMAMGRDSTRTILVEFGKVRPFSDVGGRHVIRLNGTAGKRQELASRLETAGCAVDRSGTDWLKDGDFTVPTPPGSGLPLGRRVPTDVRRAGPRMDAKYHDRGKGNGRLEIVNRGAQNLHDVEVELPEDGLHLMGDLPIKKLPAWKSVHVPAVRDWNGGPSHFEITLRAVDDTGEQVVETAFIDTMG